MATHICNHCTQEAEAGGLRIQVQTRLYNETLSEKKKLMKIPRETQTHKETNTPTQRQTNTSTQTNTRIQNKRHRRIGTCQITTFMPSVHCGKYYFPLRCFVSGSPEEHSGPDFVLGRTIFPPCPTDESTLCGRWWLSAELACADLYSTHPLSNQSSVSHSGLRCSRRLSYSS